MSLVTSSYGASSPASDGIDPSDDQGAGGRVLGAEKLAGLVNAVDQVTALVRDERPNLDLRPRQQRLDGRA